MPLRILNPAHLLRSFTTTSYAGLTCNLKGKDPVHLTFELCDIEQAWNEKQERRLRALKTTARRLRQARRAWRC